MAAKPAPDTPAPTAIMRPTQQSAEPIDVPTPPAAAMVVLSSAFPLWFSRSDASPGLRSHDLRAAGPERA